MLKVVGLTKDFVRRRWFSREHVTVRALDCVSLEVRAGSILVLTGPSGSGKTTLARCIAGFERPTAGEIRLAGRVQLVFQDPGGSLNPRFRAAEIVSEPLDIERLGTVSERRRTALELMDQCGLPRSAADRKPGELSGGQRQRLAIARALAAAPSMLILDESLSALDRSVESQILNLLLELREARGLTLLLICHDATLASRAADEVAMMRDGRIAGRVAAGQAAAL